MRAKVHVFLKPGVLDVQGKAVEQALHGLGWGGVEHVRVGRTIEFGLPAANDPEALGYCAAIGSSEQVARYSSINVDDVRLLTYILQGILVGVAVLQGLAIVTALRVTDRDDRSMTEVRAWAEGIARSLTALAAEPVLTR